MKRSRAVDGRQFRRAAKKPRFAENVYFNFSPSTWTYLKLLIVWIFCITLDLLVGVRLELGWPILLFLRHYREIVSAPNGPLRFYSTFSIFYLFLTLTSDLICYLFLPVQLLLFFASTYVWLQVAYQWMSTERGLSPRVVFFWMAFASFEYFFRFRILMPQWYNSRSVWVTAAMFPSVTDTFVANQASSHRLALYRLLASHALGFPLVTLGFKLKQSASNWMYERQRDDVQKNNEVFDRILVEALPSVYEGKKRHELRFVEGDALDFELDPTGADIDERPLFVASNGPVPSIFDKSVATTVSSSPAPSRSSNGNEATANSGGNAVYNRKTSRHSKAPMKHQNGSSNGTVTKGGKKNSNSAVNGNRNGSTAATTNSTAQANNPEEEAGDDDHVPIRTPTVISLVAWLFRTFYNALASLTPASLLFRGSGSAAEGTLDDRASSAGSGVGGDESDSDGESVATSNIDQPLTALAATTAATLKSGTNSTANTVQTNTSQVTATASASTTSTTTAPTQSGSGKKKGKQKQNQGGRGRAMTSEFNYGDGDYEVGHSNGFNKGRRGNSKIESAEDELIRLRNEAKGAKLIEDELRDRIANMHQFERTAKNEMQQYKLRYDQLDSKYKAQTKQNEQSRSTIQSLEKRLLDAQVRKDAAERELLIERSTKSNGDSSTDDMLNSMRLKVAKLEAELRKIRNDVKTKEESIVKLEEDMSELQTQRSSAQRIADDGSRTVTRMQHEVLQLRKALSEENRVKQDLFKALKTSKAQIDTLEARLRSLGYQNVEENAGATSLGYADGIRLSPTFVTTPVTTTANRAPENFDQLFSMTGMPYSFANPSLASLRMSPSDLRGSPPTIVPGELTPIVSTQSLTP